MLNRPRNDCLPSANFLPPEPPHVPLFPVDGTRQHGRHLIDDEAAGRNASPAADQPEAAPFDPLAQIVRVQHPSKQSRFGHQIDPGDGFAPPLSRLLVALVAIVLITTTVHLLPSGRAPDLPQLIVMVYVAQQTEGEEDGTGHDRELAVLPVGRRDGAVPGQPAAQAGGVAELEAESGQEDDGMDGRHGIIEDERRQKGSIEIVNGLEKISFAVIP